MNEINEGGRFGRRLQKSRNETSSEYKQQQLNPKNVCDNYYRYFPTDLPKDAFGFCEKILLCLLLFPTRSRGEDYRRADDEEGGCETRGVSRDLFSTLFEFEREEIFFPRRLLKGPRAPGARVCAPLFYYPSWNAQISLRVSPLKRRVVVFFHRAHLLLLLLLLLNRINNDPPLAL